MSFQDLEGCSWDFECPECGAMWNNEGDPIHSECEDECPGCHKTVLLTAEYSVDYEIRMKPTTPPTEDKAL